MISGIFVAFLGEKIRVFGGAGQPTHTLTHKRIEAKSPYAGGIAARRKTRRGAAATPALIPATKSDSGIPSNLLFAFSSGSPHTGRICPFSRSPFSCPTPAEQSPQTATHGLTGGHKFHPTCCLPSLLAPRIRGIFASVSFICTHGERPAVDPS